MTRLIFIRHGQSIANVKHIFAGQADYDLTELGHMQAERTAAYVMENYQIDVIYSSDLVRAYHTAKHVADNLGIETITNQNLREIYAAQWQGLTYDEILERYMDDYNAWLHDIGNSHCTGGESVQQLSDRVCHEVEKIVEENVGKTILIVTHATPIRALQCRWSNKSLNDMKDVPWVPNSSVSVMNLKNNACTLEVWGEDGYLEGIKSSFPANV